MINLFMCRIGTAWAIAAGLGLALAFMYCDAVAVCTPAPEAVDVLYLRLMGRHRDVPESNLFVKDLTAGATIRATVRAIILSPGWSAKYAKAKSTKETVTALYRQLLNRDPDPSGLASQAGILATNGLVNVVNGFLTSPEYVSRSGDWGLPGTTNRVCEYPTTIFTSPGCGLLHPTSCSVTCLARKQHGEYSCDFSPFKWEPHCYCANGPANPRNNGNGGADNPGLDQTCPAAPPMNGDTRCTLESWSDVFEVTVFEENSCGTAGVLLNVYRLQRNVQSPVINSRVGRIMLRSKLGASSNPGNYTGAWCRNLEVVHVP
jgi:hypothetical protein